MSETTPTSARSSMRPVGRTASPGLGTDTTAGVPSPRRGEGLLPPVARPSLQGRLVALGVAELTARALEQRYDRAGGRCA